MRAQEPPQRADADLIAETLAGNEAAFAELVRRHRPRIFQIASRYARGQTELEELAQEVFVKAYFALPQFRGDAPLEHWLARIAVRTCYDHLRARQRHPEVPMADLSGEQARWLEQAATAQSAEQEATLSARREARELLEQVLARLKPAERLVVGLLELDGRSVRHVAGLTGWSETLVKVRAFRARRAMRRIIEEMEHESRPS